MNKRILIGILTLTLFAPAFSFAHQEKEVAQTNIKRVEIKENMTEKRDAVKKEIMEKRDEVKEVRSIKAEQVKTLRADTAQKREMLKTEIKAKQDALKTDVQQKREAIKMEAKTLSPEALKEKRTMLREDIKKERTEVREQIKEKREVFKDEAKERVEALKKKVSEEKSKRVEAFFGTMVRKFEAAISRLRTLADRIDSRLDKFEEAGKDVSVLRTSLDKAKMVIDEAENSLDKAKEEFNALSQSEKPEEYFKKVKNVVADVAQKIKDAHKALVDVINSTKGVSVKVPSSTSTTTSQ